MISNKSPLEIWLSDITNEVNITDETWDPGFDGNRQLVITQLGPFRKVFQRPLFFTPRFYHQIYPLPIEDWELASSVNLYGGLCTLNIKIMLRFQATVQYAAAHVDKLSTINQYIKETYEGLIRDCIDQELKKLDSGEWIESDLTDTEKGIQNQINETLVTQFVQCRSFCTIHPLFADITDSQTFIDSYSREDIYLKVLKKNFEFKERQNIERLRQQEEQERLLLEQRSRETELKLKEQALEAEAKLRLMEEQQKHLNTQFELEERLYLERIRHQTKLQELELEKQLEAQELQLAKQLEIERRLQDEKLKHQQLLKQKELQVELAHYEEQQAQWIATKEKMQQEKIKQEQRLKQIESEAELITQAQKQAETQRLQEKLYEEKLRHESKLKEMELAMQIEEQRKRYEATKETSEYLRRDIELLVLEKRRNEMIVAAKEAKQRVVESPRELSLTQQEENSNDSPEKN